MSINTKYAGDADPAAWNGYVSRHPDASHFHLFGWRDVIRGTYGWDTNYLMAVRGEREAVGVLPLVHVKSLLFGNCLVSLPYVDGGGVLAESKEVEERLLVEAVTLARRIGVGRIDLRCERAVSACDDMSQAGGAGLLTPVRTAKRSSKVRMLLKLPGSSAELVKSFKSKLRSQINRPLNEGCTSSIGGVELLEDFYRVFLVNMRDLGSPVHAMDLMRRVLEVFSESTRIIVVYSAGTPIASALVTGFNRTLRNPWASFDRRYSFISPNMLLYLRMLEFACDNGYKEFDFGRSTTGEGTFKFKEQWGALASPLHWYLMSLDGEALDPDGAGIERFGLAAGIWSRLPLAVTKVLGPRIRKHISL